MSVDPSAKAIQMKETARGIARQGELRPRSSVHGCMVTTRHVRTFNHTHMQDIVQICKRFLELRQKKALAGRSWQEGNGTYNMGGPDRLSRLDMAHVVADVRGHDKGRISGAKSAAVSRPFQSPQVCACGWGRGSCCPPRVFSYYAEEKRLLVLREPGA